MIRSVPALPPRPRDAHKGDFGRVLVVAGSPGMTGAAALAARATLRVGAGMTLVACPRSLHPILEAKLTSCMTRPLPETKEGTLRLTARREILSLSDKWSTLALGPGLSTHPETRRLVLSLLPSWEGPVVVDADGLSHIAASPDVLRHCHRDMVLTPHPGEFARLSGSPVAAVQGNRAAAAAAYALDHRVILVLKGAGTVVSDGDRVYVNRTGNPGMATAGSGDVLTGTIAGLLAQGMEPFDAARLGVYLHGLAGDLGADALGEHSLTAEDILDSLPAALKARAGKAANGKVRSPRGGGTARGGRRKRG